MSQRESTGSPASPRARDGGLASAVLGRAEQYSHGILGLNAGLDRMLVSFGGARPTAAAFGEPPFPPGSYRAVENAPAPAPGAPQDAVTPGPADGEDSPEAVQGGASDAPDEGSSWVRRLETMAERLEARMMERDTAPPLESIGMPVPEEAAPPQPRPSGRRSRIQEAPAPVTIEPGAATPPGRTADGAPAPAGDSPAPADQATSAARPPAAADTGTAADPGGAVQRTPAPGASPSPPVPAQGARAPSPPNRPAVGPPAEPPTMRPPAGLERVAEREVPGPPPVQPATHEGATPGPLPRGSALTNAGLAAAPPSPAEHPGAPDGEPQASVPAVPGPQLQRRTGPPALPARTAAAAGTPETRPSDQTTESAQGEDNAAQPAGPAAGARQSPFLATEARKASSSDSSSSAAAPIGAASAPVAPGTATPEQARAPGRDAGPRSAEATGLEAAANVMQRAAPARKPPEGPAPGLTTPDKPGDAEAPPERPADAPGAEARGPAESIQRHAPPEAAPGGHAPGLPVQAPAGGPSAVPMDSMIEAAPPGGTSPAAPADEPPASATSTPPPAPVERESRTAPAPAEELQPIATPPSASAGMDTREVGPGPTNRSSLSATPSPESVVAEGPFTAPAETGRQPFPDRTADQGVTGGPEQVARAAAATAAEASVAPLPPPLSPSISQATAERGTIRRRVAAPQPPSAATAPPAPAAAPPAAAPAHAPEPPTPGPASEGTRGAPGVETPGPGRGTGLVVPPAAPATVPGSSRAHSSTAVPDEHDPASRAPGEVSEARLPESQQAGPAPSAEPSIPGAGAPEAVAGKGPSAAALPEPPVVAPRAETELRAPSLPPAPPVGPVQRRGEPSPPPPDAPPARDAEAARHDAVLELQPGAPRVAASRRVVPATSAAPAGMPAESTGGREASWDHPAREVRPVGAPPAPPAGEGMAPPPAPLRPDAPAAVPMPAIFPFPLAQRRVARNTGPSATPAAEEKPGARYQAPALVAGSSGPAEPPAPPIQRQIATPQPRSMPSATPSAGGRGPEAQRAGTSKLSLAEAPRPRATVVPAARERQGAASPPSRLVVPAAPAAMPASPSGSGAVAPGGPAAGDRRAALAPERPAAAGSTGVVQRTPSRSIALRPGPPAQDAGRPGAHGQVPPGPSEVLQRAAAATPVERPQLPLAPPPARQVVQRAEEPVGSVTKVEPAPEAPKPPDIDRIADRVWKKIKRDLRVERERERGMP